VTGGFVTEGEHLTETDRFLAPMDQTHTLTGGVTYRHMSSGLWTSALVEYGSGTPFGHGSAEHEHAAGEAAHEDGGSIAEGTRVPGHMAGSVTFGVDVWRTGAGPGRSKLSFQVDIENVSDNRYLIAQEGEFSPRQFAIPRLVSLSARIRF
jgi:hypothetical protein